MNTEVPLYEDISEVTTPTEIKTTHDEAYGPVKMAILVYTALSVMGCLHYRPCMYVHMFVCIHCQV